MNPIDELARQRVLPVLRCRDAEDASRPHARLRRPVAASSS